MGDRETGRQVYGAGEKDQSVSSGGWLGDLGCRDLGKGLSEGGDRAQRFPPRDPCPPFQPSPSN